MSCSFFSLSVDATLEDPFFDGGCEESFAMGLPTPKDECYLRTAKDGQERLTCYCNRRLCNPSEEMNFPLQNMPQ